jgi:hypothetical protein
MKTLTCSSLTAFFLAAFLLTVAIPSLPRAVAQTANAHTETSAPVLAFGFGPVGEAILPKPHAPFSAVLVQQLEQTLNDGTHISRDNNEIVMRDGMGRIYRERAIHRPGSPDTVLHSTITLLDPILRVQYLCNSVRKGCTKMEYRQHPNLRASVFPEKGKGITVEDLGPATISGLEVEGKRVTREIPEGAVGNDRPMTTTVETWHSHELDVDVQVKRSDLRAGTRTNTLTDVQIGEPDPKYFQVPEGYRINQRPASTGMLSPLPSESTSYPTGAIAPN